ncbi:MAG: autotransporter-associated beta strand repeat-containing protein [Verrucomicrobiota bacterium]
MFSDTSKNITFGGVVSGGGKLILDGYTIVKLNAANTFSGNTEINKGEVWVGPSGDLTSSAIFVGNGSQTANIAKFFMSDTDGGSTFTRTINVNPGNGNVDNRTVGGINTSGENIFSSTISRASSVGLTLYSGGGTVAFSGDITGSGSVLINADNANGTVRYTTTAKTYAADTFVLDGELLIEGNYIPQAVSVGETSGSDDAALMIGTGGVTENANVTVRTGGSGVLTVGGRNTSGAATYSGSVTLEKATVFSAAGTGGTVDYTGAIGGNQAASISGPGTNRFSGTSANDFSSVAVNSGFLDLNKTAGTAAIDADVTVASAATLRNLAANQIADTATVTVSGTWNLNGNSETISNLVLNSGGLVKLGSAAQLILNKGEGTYAGTFSGESGSSIVKKGPTTISVTGDNSNFTGTWFAVGGVVGLNHNNAVGTGNTVNLGETGGSDAATLDSSVSDTIISNNIIVRSGSSGTKKIDNATSTGSRTVTFAGSLTLNDNLTVDASTSETTALSGVISGAGKLIKQGGGVLTLDKTNTYSGNTEIDDGTLKLAGGDLTQTAGIFLGNGGNALSTTLELSTGGIDISDRTLQVNPSTGAGTRTLNVTATSGSDTIGAINLQRDLTINANSGGALTVGAVNLSHSGNNNLTVNDSSAVVIAGAITGGGQLVKQGTGRLTVSAVSGFTGATSIDGGSLTVSGDITASSAIALGNTGNSSDAALELSANGVDIDRSLTVNTSTGSGARTIESTANSGATTYSGGITMNRALTIKAISGSAFNASNIIANANQLIVTNDNAVTLSGAVTTALAGPALAKSGSGILTLAGNLDNVNLALTNRAGTTVLGKTSSAAVHAVGTGVTILGGTVQLGGTGSDQIFSNSDVIVTAGSFDANGRTEAFDSLTGAGTVDNTSASAASLSVGTGNDGGAGTFSGVIQNSGGGALAITKEGTGTMVLSGTSANTYSGLTTVNGGQLTLNKSSGNAISGNLTISAGNVQLSAANQISDTAAVTVTGTLNLNNNNETIGALSGSGNVTLGSGVLTVGDATSTSFSGVISGSGGQLTKQGAGVLTLSGGSANTYNGVTTINAGELDLNKSAGTDAIGGNITIGDGTGGVNADILKLLASNQINNASAITLGSSGFFNLNSFSETIASVTGSGNIDLGSSAVLTLGDANNQNLSGVISGSGSLLIIKQGTGILTLSGASANTYSGIMNINVGEMDLQKTAGIDAIAGSVTIGDGTGGANADILKLLAGNQIKDTVAVTINSSGLLDLNSFNETIKSLAGSGNVVLNGGNLTVQNTAAALDTFTGVISGSGNFIKSGSSTQVLSTASSYLGSTTINAGMLRVGTANALPTGTDVTLANTAGAIMDINGNAQTISSLSGGGAAGGNVTLGAGSLILSQNSDTTYGGVISGSSGSLTKNGTGRLTLTGINTYTGATIINAGSITVNSGAALSGSSAITVTNAGNLIVNGTAGAVTINSGGLLKGSGTVGALVVNSGGSFSPGNSPGTQSAGATTWAGGGNYIWEFNDFDASQGTDPGWDFLNITGGLNITSTSGNQFNIDVTSLTLGNVAGLVADFDANATQTWTIATASGGVTGFAANKFNLDLSAFANPYSGTWSILQSGNSVQLKYEGAPLSLVVPEPTMVTMLSVGAMILYFRRRRALRLERS